MGLFKNIISLKKGKEGSPNKTKGSLSASKSNGFKLKNSPDKASVYGFTVNSPGSLEIPIEDLAATRIQTAFRAYKARKSLRNLKGMARAKALTQRYSVKKQATTTLSYVHTWSNIQTLIKARRVFMVTDCRLKQKKFENQQKLEAKLHDLEVEWCGGSETKEEVLARIHQREEASVKRERAMAYAFTHQWRADSKHQWLGNYEFGKADWGWSWKERWIAARPWEVRAPPQTISPKKLQNKKPVAKVDGNTDSPARKASVPVKTILGSSTKGTKAPRRLSFPGAEKPTAREGSIRNDPLRATA